MWSSSICNRQLEVTPVVKKTTIMWLILMKHVCDSFNESTWRDAASQRKEFIVKQIGDDSKTEVCCFCFF